MFDFPNTPAIGQTVAGSNGAFYMWDGVKWEGIAAPTAIGDAPVDGNTYGRRNQTWTQVLPITTGGADYSPALTAAIAQLITSGGGKILLPAGQLTCNSAVVATIPTGVTIVIEGMGPAASTLYFANATDGLNFTVANTAGVCLCGFSIIRGPTSPKMANTGLSISVVSGDPLYAGNSSLRDLVVRGSQSAAQVNQWLNGIIIAGVCGISIDNVAIKACNATATDQGDILLSLAGGAAPSQYGTSFKLSNSDLTGGSCGVQVSGWVQGVFIVNNSIVGQYDGIRWTGGGPYGAEEVSVGNCSLNAAHRAVYLSQVNQCSVIGNTILHFNAGAVGFAGVEINQSGYNSVVGNNIVGANAGTESGIIISATPSGANTVVGNATTNITGAGIWLQGTTTGATIGDNAMIGGTGLVMDTPAGNVVGGGNIWNNNPVALSPANFTNYGTGDLNVGMIAPAGTNRMLAFNSANVARWYVGTTADAETGSNAGSNFEIIGYADNGTALQGMLQIQRATGVVTIPSGLATSGGVDVTGNQNVTAQLGVYDAAFSYSGTITGARSGGDWQLSLLETTSDTLDAGGGGFLGQYIHLNSGGGNTSGNRVGQYINTNFSGSTLDKARSYPGQYGGQWVYAHASGNAGGTSLGASFGHLWGGLASATLQSGATFWSYCVGMEVDVGVSSGASAAFAQGLKIVIQNHAQAASPTNDSLLGMAKTTLSDQPFANGIMIGMVDGYWPIASNGTMIGTQASVLATPPPQTAANGVDFSAVTFSGSAFKSTGFSVDGSGNVLPHLLNAANDAAAASAGVPLGALYRNGNAVQIRLT